MVLQARPRQDLGKSHHRGEETMLAHQIPDRRIGDPMQRVIPVEEGDDGSGVEDYRHSPRKPFTVSASRPSASRAPL